MMHSKKKSISENFKMDPRNFDYLKGYVNLIRKSEKECKYLPVKSKNQNCPKKYPIYDGHTFDNRSKEFCSITKNPNSAMRVFVKNGKISKVSVLSSDRGFDEEIPPVLQVDGDGGSGAKLRPIIKNKKIVKIDVLGAGSGYADKTNIKIKHMTGDDYCKLCCTA